MIVRTTLHVDEYRSALASQGMLKKGDTSFSACGCRFRTLTRRLRKWPDASAAATSSW